MKGKRILQRVLLICLAFLWMPEVAHAKDESMIIEVNQGTTFDTFQVAMNKANNAVSDVTIQLKDDVELTQSNECMKLANTNHTITFDGNGHTLTLKGISFGVQGSVILKNITVKADLSECTYIFQIEADGKLVMENGTSLENIGQMPYSIIEVLENGEFNMNNGAIINKLGMGVMNKGIFTMNAGSVNGVSPSAVRVEDGGTFTLNNGNIHGSDGVESCAGATFIMNGGTVQGDRFNGVYNDGTFTMNDGNINGKIDKGVNNAGTFTMNDGNIDGKIDTGVNNSGTFTMNSGTINGMDTGVYNTGTFTMNDGGVQGKTGTGIVVMSTGNKTRMNGGSITGCAKKGVVIFPDYTFTMTAGTITDNVESDVDIWEGGIFIQTRGTTTVGKVTGNGTRRIVEPDPSTDPETPGVTPTNPESHKPEKKIWTPENHYGVFQQYAIQTIEAADKGPIVLDTSIWISFKRNVYEEMQKKGLAVQLTFLYEGVKYRVIIPAGADVLSLVDDNGYCGFLNLMAHFGGTVVK